jgi:hypothetical protein
VFGAAANQTFCASHYSEIIAKGPTNVVGGSVAFAHATTRSIIGFSKQTITFAPNLCFTRYLWGVNDATVKLDKGSIIGSATGDIAVHINGVLNVSSLKGEWRGGKEERVLEGGVIAMGKQSAEYAEWKQNRHR